jgi:uncharacterized protein YndB with AHSA1/START domain
MKENEVVIERLFNAPVELVWMIWTQPEYIKMWFGSDPDGTVLSADINLSVGGKYSISFSDSDGSLHTAFGEYLEITENSKLHFTFEWKSEPGHISELMMEFISQAQRTITILTHTNLNPNSIHGYREGWNGALNKIIKKIIEQ